jgi:hypothetical protein
LTAVSELTPSSKRLPATRPAFTPYRGKGGQVRVELWTAPHGGAGSSVPPAPERGLDLTPDPESNATARDTWAGGLACRSTSNPLGVSEVEHQASQKNISNNREETNTAAGWKEVEREEEERKKERKKERTRKEQRKEAQQAVGLRERGAGEDEVGRQGGTPRPWPMRNKTCGLVFAGRWDACPLAV